VTTPVYVKMFSAAYNFRMQRRLRNTGILPFVFFSLTLCGQTPRPDQLTILTKEMPSGSLWTPYRDQYRPGFQLRATGGIEPYHWRVVNGVLPAGLKLDESSEITGVPQESGNFQFALELHDSRIPPLHASQKVTLIVEAPFSAEWDHKAQVSGNRIDGSVKVSNRTGRDFDLTFVVLAVNDIGRATAIGYQHFSLKKNTRNMSLPFGETLSPGNYTVNVDVVGEEPIARRIFRARLVAGKRTISQGP